MAKRNITFQFDQGYVSARDETELEGGELISGVGAYYKPGDPTRIWKEEGRQTHYNFDNGSVDKQAIKGLTLCQFDLNVSGINISGAIHPIINKLVAYIDDRLEYINPERTPIGSGVLVSGVRPSGLANYEITDRMFSVHLNDLWYLNTTNDRPYVLNQETLANPRKMGMLPPTLDINGGVSGIGGLSIAGAATINLTPTLFQSSSWWWLKIIQEGFRFKWDRVLHGFGDFPWFSPLIDSSNVTDNDDNTFGYLQINTNKPVAFTQISNFPSNTSGQDRWLRIVYQIGTTAGGSNFGIGTTLGETGVTFRIEVELQRDDEPTGYYVPHPYLDPQHPEYKTDDWVVQSYNLDSSKGRRAEFVRMSTPMSQPTPIRIDLPPNYDISGMMVRISLQPRVWNFSNISLGVPTMSQALDTTVRIYDCRVVDGTTSVLGQGIHNQISGVRYAITEIAKHDSVRIESVPGAQSKDLYFTNNTGATFLLPSGSINPAATHYGIYRSNLPNGLTPSGVTVEWNTFGRVEEVPVNRTSGVKYIDDFRTPIFVTPSPLVGTIAISADDNTTVWKLRDYPPPAMRHLSVFKGSIVGISNVNRRSLVYSYAAFPESYPDFHAIDYFPLDEKDMLIGTHALNNILIILAEGAVMTMTELPHARLGRIVASDVDKIEGAPGCVGEYAFTEAEIDGFPVLAYVSIHGVYITDGHSAKRISDDLAWDVEVNRSTLNRSKLFFDKDFKHLIFIYDKNGDDINDTKMIFHLDPIHRKQSGMPKILGPTPANLSDMVQGQIEEEYRIFSGASESQKIFVERSGVADASNSWSGGAGANIVPFDIKTGRMYGDWEFLSAIRGNLRHTDWGTGNQISGIWTAGRDDGDNSTSVIKDINLAGHKGDELFIGRAGEYHQLQLTHTTSGTKVGGIHHMKVKVQQHGSDSGDI